ncbi:hypothetical protein ACJX0J_037286 [Zea mays]
MGMGMGLIGSRSTLIEEASYYFLLSHSIIVVPIIVVQEEVLDWAELYHSAYQNGLVEIYSGNEERIKGGPARNIILLVGDSLSGFDRILSFYFIDWHFLKSLELDPISNQLRLVYSIQQSEVEEKKEEKELGSLLNRAS